jgi:sugar lactone lactonase YvrE
MTAMAQPTVAADPAGVAPRYTSRSLSKIPNARAVTRRIWSPGIDVGYVPQGVSFIDGAVYVSAFWSVHRKVSKGPCRIYRIDPKSGRVTGKLKLPRSCTHAGGLAKGAPGILFLSDTHKLFKIALAPRNDPKLGKVVQIVRLRDGVKGSFAAGLPGRIFLGSYQKKRRGRLHVFGTAKLPRSLQSSEVLRYLSIAPRSQGAAFDRAGFLWITQSSSKFGRLQKIDPNTGAVLKRYRMPVGIEDISFDARGQLWAVSEAGTRRWRHWTTFYPVVFRLDPAKLR